MPAFAFVSGYFAVFDLNKILKKQILPYFVWYVIYFVLFVQVFAEKNHFNPTTPYWLTWYLMSMVWWSMSIPLLRAMGKNRPWVVIAVLCIVSALWGFCGVSGYWLSIGRTLTFFPFFAAGYFLREREIPQKIKPMAKTAAVCLVVACGAVCVLFSKYLDIQCFYGAKSYAQPGQSFNARIFQLFAGSVWILLLICFAPKSRLPLLTDAGRYSMAVYLGHGIIVRIMKKLLPGGMSGNIWVLMGAVASVVLTAALGNRCVYAVVAKTFSFLPERKKQRSKSCFDNENADAV